jgi:threonine dehydratase
MVTWDDVTNGGSRTASGASRIARRSQPRHSSTRASAPPSFLKCENFQRVGAFKFRGAYNAISRIPEGDRARGVLAYSSGNHAQAVALACRLLGCKRRSSCLGTPRA